MAIVKRLLRRHSRQRERLNTSGLSICSSVRLSVAKTRTKTRFSQNLSSLRAMVSIDHYRKSYGVFKEPIIGPRKFKMADGCHIKNCFGHNSPADCSISVNCVRGSSFSLNFGNGTNTGVILSVFLMQLASASGAFRIVSDTLKYTLCPSTDSTLDITLTNSNIHYIVVIFAARCIN